MLLVLKEKFRYELIPMVPCFASIWFSRFGVHLAYVSNCWYVRYSADSSTNFAEYTQYITYKVTDEYLAVGGALGLTAHELLKPVAAEKGGDSRPVVGFFNRFYRFGFLNLTEIIDVG
jgi:hypothetical protein